MSNTYKDFVIVHNIRLDPREVSLFLSWLKTSDDIQVQKIVEAMEAAIDNYATDLQAQKIVEAMEATIDNTMSKTLKCANLNFEGECRVTNALCDNCISLGRLLEE